LRSLCSHRYEADDLVEPWKGACLALSDCELMGGGSSIPTFVTSEFCCNQINKDATALISGDASDSGVFATGDTCSNRWGCKDFYEVALGGAETELGLSGILTPFLAHCEDHYDEDGGDGFNAFNWGESGCKDNDDYVDGAGNGCDWWVGKSCDNFETGFGESENLRVRSNCPVSCNVCVPEVVVEFMPYDQVRAAACHGRRASERSAPWEQ
jgi:hypothetical protein